MKTRFPIGSRVFSFSAIPFSKNKYLCISYNRIMLDYKYNTLRLAFLLAAIMLVAPCCKQKSNPTTQQIELVKRQVSADREALHEIESVDYPQLEEDFYHCDSMLQYVDQETAVQQFDKLNLAKAYLIQFQETLPRMQADIDSSLLQLDRLEADANRRKRHCQSAARTGPLFQRQTRQQPKRVGYPLKTLTLIYNHDTTAAPPTVSALFHLMGDCSVIGQRQQEKTETVAAR